MGYIICTCPHFKVLEPSMDKALFSAALLFFAAAVVRYTEQHKYKENRWKDPSSRRADVV